MKVAIYARVSKSKQELKNQIPPLQEFAKKRGYEVTRVYEDIATGKNANREAFREMMRDAHYMKFKAILVWSLDRLSREGMYKTVNLLEHLNRIGVGVVSYTEQYLDTTNEIFKDIMIALLSTLAKAERDKISERTKAGLERAKREGKRIGRPGIAPEIRKKAIEMVKKFGVRGTARRLDVSPAYVSVAVRA